MKISATDAAFAGFGLVRRAPGAFAVWTLLTLIYTLSSTALQAWLTGPAMERMATMQAAGSTTPPTSEQMAQLMSDLGGFGLFYIAILMFALVYMSVMNAAVLRAMLRPGDGGFGYLRFGKDELRQAGAGLLVWLIIYGVYIAAALIGTILLVVGIFAFVALTGGGKAGGTGDSPAAIAGAIVAGLLMVLIIIAPVLIAVVRLSLVGAATFARGKVDIAASWRLTRGRFWTVFGAFVLSAFVIMVISTLALTVVAVGALFAGVSLEAVGRTLIPDAKTMNAVLLSPLRLVFLLVGAPLNALWFVMQASIAATIYAQTLEARDEAGLNRSHAFGRAVAFPSAPPPSQASPAPPAPVDTPPDAL